MNKSTYQKNQTNKSETLPFVPSFQVLPENIPSPARTWENVTTWHQGQSCWKWLTGHHCCLLCCFHAWHTESQSHVTVHKKSTCICFWWPWQWHIYNSSVCLLCCAILKAKNYALNGPFYHILSVANAWNCPKQKSNYHRLQIYVHSWSVSLTTFIQNAWSKTFILSVKSHTVRSHHHRVLTSFMPRSCSLNFGLEVLDKTQPLRLSGLNFCCSSCAYKQRVNLTCNRAAEKI